MKVRVITSAILCFAVIASFSMHANAKKGISKIQVLDMEVLRTDSATDLGGIVAINAASIVGITAILTAAAVATDQPEIAEAGPELGLALGATIVHSTGGSDDDLIAFLSPGASDGFIKGEYLQYHNGRKAHHTVGEGSLITVSAHRAVYSIDNPDQGKKEDLPIATLYLSEWDSMSADDDMGTLHIYSYDHMSRKKPAEKVTKKGVTYLDVDTSGALYVHDDFYLRSVILNGPGDSDEASEYRIRYIVWKDAGSCKHLTPLGKFMYGKTFPKEKACK
ncbi:MAG: hypothetical protein ACI9UN_005450 [Granulosicoccus sp.]|jgi:hypothetical protein